MNEISKKQLISLHLINNVFLHPRLKDRGHQSLSFETAAVQIIISTEDLKCFVYSVFIVFCNFTLTLTGLGLGLRNILFEIK